MFDFSANDEQKSNNFAYVGTGIHDFDVKKIYFQPQGESVNGETKKDGSPVSFGLPQIRIQAVATATYAGKDSVGSEITLSILDPFGDPEKAKNRMDRIVHIFSNMSSTALKPNALAWFKKLKVTGLEDLGNKLGAAFSGKKVRFKLIATQDGKYARLPDFYNGVAETVDTPIANSLLQYDEDRDGTTKKDESKVEKPTTGSQPYSLFGASTTPASTASGIPPATTVAEDLSLDLPF